MSSRLRIPFISRSERRITCGENGLVCSVFYLQVYGFVYPRPVVFIYYHGMRGKVAYALRLCRYQQGNGVGYVQYHKYNQYPYTLEDEIRNDVNKKIAKAKHPADKVLADGRLFTLFVYHLYTHYHLTCRLPVHQYFGKQLVQHHGQHNNYYPAYGAGIFMPAKQRRQQMDDNIVIKADNPYIYQPR